jgi:hypothetical protein
VSVQVCSVGDSDCGCGLWSICVCHTHCPLGAAAQCVAGRSQLNIHWVKDRVEERLVTFSRKWQVVARVTGPGKHIRGDPINEVSAG